MRKIEMIGKTYNHLTAVKEYESVSAGMKYLFQCDCGNTTVQFGHTVRKGKVKSCGCARGSYVAEANKCRDTHDMTGTPTYRSWQGMKQRCNNPNIPDFQSYGAKGVSVCDRWMNSFDAFVEDMGVRPEGTSIDRINPFGNYEPDNCRWADPYTQYTNRRRNYVALPK